MTLRYLQFSLIGMLVFAAGVVRGEDEKKFADLDGTWTLIKVDAGGKSLLEKDEKRQLIIKDGKMTYDGKGGSKESMDLSKYLDPSHKPHTITCPYEGRITFYGIYEIKDDELRVCGDGVDTATEKNPESRRPREFDSSKGLLIVLKREKK